MSKLAEQKALEAYPIKILVNDDLSSQDINVEHRNGFRKGYDQCFSDIEEFLQDCFYIHPHDCHVVQYDSDTPLDSIDDLIEQIKQYIQK